jgi:hypothetical protein
LWEFTHQEALAENFGQKGVGAGEVVFAQE